MRTSLVQPPPAFLPEEGHRSHSLRRIRANNRSLERVRAIGSPLGRHIAEVRWLTLQLSSKEHAVAAGITPCAQRNVERGSATARSHHDTYERIHTFWEAQCVTQEQRERLLRLFIERQYAVRGEPEIDPKQSRALSTFDLYRRWGYMRGHKKLFANVKTGSRRDERFTEGGLWQRRASQTVPEWEEIERVHRALRLPEEEWRSARDAWLFEKQRQLLGRGIPQAYADALLAIEASGTRLIASALTERFGVTQDVARALSAGRPVRREEVERIAREVMDAGDYKEWRREWGVISADTPKETLIDTYVRVRNARGLTNEQIARAMMLPSPRPSQHIRRTLEDITASDVAPAGVILGLAAGSDRDGETEEFVNERLRMLFLEKRRALLLVAGSTAGKSDLRLLRDYWGIKAKELTSVARMDRDLIARVEQGKKQVPPQRMQKLLSLVESLGQARLEEARQRLHAHADEREQALAADPISLDAFTDVLTKRVGSLLALRRLSQNAYVRGGTSVDMLKRIGTGKGQSVPPLCLLRRLLERTGALLTPELEEDWYRHYPECMSKQPGEYPPHTPLGRIIATRIATRWMSLNQFHAEMMKGMIGYSTFIRNVQRINAGKHVPWPMIERCLLPTGITQEDPLYIFTRCLVDEGGDVRAALRAWRGIARALPIENFRVHERTFGLLPREAPDVWRAAATSPTAV